MGRLIVIEGLDGAGKRTLTNGIAEELTAHGHSVARLAFPRYSDDIHAALLGEALRGGHGDLGESVHGMAVLYALDRRAAAPSLRADLRAVDVVLVDRYVASNAAYGAARLHQDSHGDFVSWLHELEAKRFALPKPDLQILLQVPTEVAAQRAESREQQEADRQRDSFESDAGLQQRCGKVYEQLAADNWWSPWVVVDGASTVDFAELVENHVLGRPGGCASS